MPPHVAAARRIPARARTLYGIISDYRAGHPRILPPRRFGELRVEAGGVGAGTRIRFTMNVFGAHELNAVIEEPEPGRVLVERYPDTGIVTTFTVDPADDAARVEIRTVWPRGVRGLLERALSGRLLRRIFREELAMLEEVAVGDEAAAATSPSATARSGSASSAAASPGPASSAPAPSSPASEPPQPLPE